MKQFFKKALCAALVLSLLFGCVGAAFAAQTEDALCLTAISDTHFYNAADYGSITENENYDADYPFYHATFQGQMSAESEAILRSFLDTYEQTDSEYLLISGDLTDGSIVNHEALAAILGEFEERTGKSIFVIAGNHDIDDDNKEKFTSADEFKQNYRAFGYDEALCIDPASTAYTCELEGNFRLLAIDSCDYGKDSGKIDAAKLKWIEEQVKAAKNDGKTLIAMMHHSVMLHFSVQDIIENYAELTETFADWGLKYIFTGHMHGNDIAQAVSKNGSKLYDVMTGSLITSPCSYREVEFSADKAVITTDYVTEIDTQYLPEGYSEEQLSLISSDFPAYADKFFEVGMRYWINRMFGSARKVGSWLKVEKGTKAYETLDDIMGIVGAALNLPLYNTAETPEKYDSIEEVAARYGYTLPESDYEYTYQIIAKVMGDFFKGDENIPGDSAEVRILFSVVPCALTHAIGSLITEYGMTDGMANLLRSLNISTIDSAALLNKNVWFLAQRGANALVAAILVPIVESVSKDAYIPADLNVTLDGAEDGTTVPLTFFAKLIDYFKVFFKVLFTYLF